MKKYPEIPRPERFNIVGAAEVDNLTMAKLVYEYVKKLMPNVPPLNIEMENFHGSRPGHDLRYSLDGTKIKELGYTYPKPFEASLEKTVEWYVENKEWFGL